jgi:hypothetical protein
VALLAVAAAGCGAEERVFVQTAGMTFELGFPLLISEGHAALVLDAFGDALARPLLLERTLEPGQQIALIGLDAAALRATGAPFLDGAEAKVRLSIEPPPAEPRIRRGTNEIDAQVAIPPEAVIAVAGRDSAALSPASADLAAALRAALTLTVPVDPEPCRIERPLVPFGATGALLADRIWDQSYLQAVRIVDRDRVLAISKTHLYLFRRGEPAGALPAAPGAPGGIISFDANKTGEVMIESISIGPPAPDGSRRVVAIVVDQRNTDDRSWVEDLILDPRGLRWVASASMSADRPVTTGLIDPSGTTVVAGGERTVLTRGANDAALVARAPPENELASLGVLAKFRALAATGNAAVPHLMGGESQVYFGDAVAGRWETSTLVISLTRGKYQISDLVLDPILGTQEIWTAGDSWLYRRQGGQWADIAPEYPPRFLPCVKPNGLPNDLRNVRLTPKRAWVSLDCSAILVIERDNLCASAIPAPDGPVGDRDLDLRGLDLRDGMLVSAGALGRVFTLDVPE